MALPDISTLTQAELATLLDDASRKLLEIRSTERLNAEAVKTAAASDVDALIKLIGPPPATAVPGTNSINELLANTKATINADPALYIKETLRVCRKITKALINGQRLASGNFESTNTGE